jgi:hypothetical protein
MTGANEQAPKILDVPIGLGATGMPQEFDSLGTVEVPADRYWGAQTQRSLEHFNIHNDRMPKEVYHAYAYVRKGRGGGSYPGGPVAGLEGRPDRAGVRRGDPGDCTRSPAVCVADRIRDPRTNVTVHGSSSHGVRLHRTPLRPTPSRQRLRHTAGIRY